MLIAEFSYYLKQPWEYVEDHLTMEQVMTYRRFWKINPPVDLLVAGFMGYKAKDEGSREANDSHTQLARFMGLSIPNG